MGAISTERVSLDELGMSKEDQKEVVRLVSELEKFAPPVKKFAIVLLPDEFYVEIKKK